LPGPGRATWIGLVGRAEQFLDALKRGSIVFGQRAEDDGQDWIEIVGTRDSPKTAKDFEMSARLHIVPDLMTRGARRPTPKPASSDGTKAPEKAAMADADDQPVSAVRSPRRTGKV
jgi:hypothetical protein